MSDVDQILAEFTGRQHTNGYSPHTCDECRDIWPCPTYRLAEQLAAARVRENNKQALLDYVYAEVTRVTEVRLDTPSDVVLAVRTLKDYADNRDGQLADLRAQLAAARGELAAIDAALLKVCPDNAPTVPADPELPRYVCIGESTDPLIETDSMVEAIRALDQHWATQQERAEAAESSLAAATARAAKVREVAQRLDDQAGELYGQRDDVTADIVREIAYQIRQALSTPDAEADRG